MKLLIIGHSVEDHFQKDGIDFIKPGGIFYTTMALQNFKEPEDEIYLCTSISNRNYELFAKVYEKIPKDYFKYVEKIPKVFLTLHNFKERGETYESISQKLDVSTFGIENFDGIIINMITGFDIDLYQLKEIRKNYKGKIFFDVHTLSRGLDENLKREFRKIPNFKEWAELLNIIQVNENEIKTLSDKTSESEIAKEILNYGTEYIIVTKGAKGARIYSLFKNELISAFVSSIKIEEKNSIGCGDVFGAVFFYNYIKTKNAVSSLRIANTAAGCSCSYSDINDYGFLRKDVFSRYN
jgi:hypothetical protein